MHVEKIKTVGDTYMCGSGLPTEATNHAESMAEMAFAIGVVRPAHATEETKETKETKETETEAAERERATERARETYMPVSQH